MAALIVTDLTQMTWKPGKDLISDLQAVAKGRQQQHRRRDPVIDTIHAKMQPHPVGFDEHQPTSSKARANICTSTLPPDATTMTASPVTDWG